MNGEAAGGNVEASVIISIGDPERVQPIVELYHDYRRQIARTGLSHEFLFVLEGGFSQILDDILELKERGEPIRILQFRQRFGDATALSAGFEHARGDILITLPPYHQVEPRSIPSLVAELDGTDLVAVRRWPRTDSRMKRFQTRAFHRLLRLLLRVDFRDLGCAVRAIRRKVVDVIQVYGHNHWFLPILARQYGFRVTEIDLPQKTAEVSRKGNRLSIYPRRLIDLLSIFFLVKFTRKPLRFFGIGGLFVFVLGIVFTGFLVYQRFIEGVPLADRPALLFGLLLIVLGIQLFAIGLIGELVIFTHSKDMREYTIERVVN